jgi:hypothetical protein
MPVRKLHGHWSHRLYWCHWKARIIVFVTDLDDGRSRYRSTARSDGGDSKHVNKRTTCRTCYLCRKRLHVSRAEIRP